MNGKPRLEIDIERLVKNTAIDLRNDIVRCHDRIIDARFQAEGLRNIANKFDLNKDTMDRIELLKDMTDIAGAIRRLAEWSPSGGFPLARGYYDEDPDAPLDENDVSKKPMTLNNGCPFFSEAYLYALLGKEDARTILALLRKIISISCPSMSREI